MTRTFDALDQEWVTLVRSEGAREALGRWAGRHPVFKGADDLGAVLRRRRNPVMARGILTALAALAPSDALAARTLLQALLPGLLCLAGTAASGDPNAPEEMLGFAWERIRTYPPTRKGSVAGNVLLDVRKDYRRQHRVEAQVESGLAEGTLGTRGPSPEDVVVGCLTLHELIEDLAVAHRGGVISRDALHLIVRTRVGGETLGEVAADTNVAAKVLKVRRWRAEQKLRQELALAS